jgi:hypothetical protein
VVRIRGAHDIVNGRFFDGTPVVGRAGGVPAAQIIDPLLRCIPVACLKRDRGTGAAGGAAHVASP